MLADVDIFHDMLILGEPLIEGPHKADSLVDAMQGVVREVETKIV